MNVNKRKLSGSSPTKKNSTLPPMIRRELRTACAMRGLSKLKSGNKKKYKDQYEYMTRFFHGRPPNNPSQIKLLAEGRLAYSDLYEEVDYTAKKKDANASTVKKLRLKHTITRDSTRNYYSGIDITDIDLEKKNLTGSVLISGRNLLDLAIKGAREYKKALSFNEHKWDSVKMQPKYSGETVEDCIEYVRREMYKLTLTEEDNNEESKADSETDEFTFISI